MIKSDLRKKYLDIQKQKEKYCLNSSNIKLIKEVVDFSKNIGFYLSINNEIDCIILNDYSKNLYVPFMKRVNDNFVMEYHKFDGNIIRDDMNVISSNGEKIDINELDCLFIPGIVFNKKGYRIGYGKACYDKALIHYHGIKIGVCDDNAFIDDDFDEKHDINVDYVLTNKNLYKIGE